VPSDLLLPSPNRTGHAAEKEPGHFPQLTVISWDWLGGKRGREGKMGQRQGSSKPFPCRTAEGHQDSGPILSHSTDSRPRTTWRGKLLKPWLPCQAPSTKWARLAPLFVSIPASRGNRNGVGGERKLDFLCCLIVFVVSIRLILCQAYGRSSCRLSSPVSPQLSCYLSQTLDGLRSCQPGRICISHSALRILTCYPKIYKASPSICEGKSSLPWLTDGGCSWWERFLTFLPEMNRG
jgi:hypothetical protein